jgi:D-threonate/D-erythronate kinase
VESFYKKIDSTLRGHVAQECLTMMQELNADCALIVPAFPSEGRQTIGGYQLVRGIPLERTDVARDPLFPVRVSHIPTLLAQSCGNPDWVGFIEISVVMKGAGPLLIEIQKQIKYGKKLIVIDACQNVDLAQIALASEKLRGTYNILPCGSAGLANAFSDLWPSASDELPLSLAPNTLPYGPTIVVSGSTTELNRNQLRYLIDHYVHYGDGTALCVVELQPKEVLGIFPLDIPLEKITTALKDRNTVIVTTALHPDSLQRTFDVATSQGISVSRATFLAQETLQKLCRVLSDHMLLHPSTFPEESAKGTSLKWVLCGGETAARVTQALGTTTVQIVAEVQPSVPLSRDADYEVLDIGPPEWSKNWYVTKSGNFGQPSTLADIIRILKHHEAEYPS